MRVEVVTDERHIAQCLQIRAEVFIVEQNVSETEERDGLDDRCVHFLATDDNGPVGAARLNYLNADYAKIQRVCVLTRARGTGAGAAIIKAMIEKVREDGICNVIRLGSQLHALEFYRKLGFIEKGDVYLDAGIEHRDMELRI